MADILTIDINEIYKAWKAHLEANSGAKYFGMLNDGVSAKFPYANLQMIGNTSNVTDLSGDECTWSLTFQTDVYIDNTKYYSVLYPMDEACRQFFVNLGFRKVGESALMSSNGITRLTSRFNLPHYNGELDNLPTISNGEITP